MTPVGILLAAGRGRRFDPSGARNKLLAVVPAQAGTPFGQHPNSATRTVVPAQAGSQLRTPHLPEPVVPAQAGTPFPAHDGAKWDSRLRGNDEGGDGDLVVLASARTLLSVLPRVIAVVPPDDGGVGDALRALGCDVTVCPDADSGMAASLVHAIGHSLPAAGAWLVALGDMPFVLPSTVQALSDALAGGAAIAAPVMNGRRGNPVGFGSAHLAQLLALVGDQGARAILMSHPVTAVPVDDPGIFRDVDTSADLSQ